MKPVRKKIKVRKAHAAAMLAEFEGVAGYIKRQSAELGWACCLCGDWHPIDHAGLHNVETGEHCCCSCEPKLRARYKPIVGVLHPGPGAPGGASSRGA